MTQKRFDWQVLWFDSGAWKMVRVFATRAECITWGHLWEDTGTYMARRVTNDQQFTGR